MGSNRPHTMADQLRVDLAVMYDERAKRDAALLAELQAVRYVYADLGIDDQWAFVHDQLPDTATLEMCLVAVKNHLAMLFPECGCEVLPDGRELTCVPCRMHSNLQSLPIS